jgi:putative transposase
MSTKYTVKDQNALYFLTFTIVGLVDVFSRKVYRDIMIASLKYCQKNKGLELFAYVIMSNHVHLIARADEGYLLSDILRDMKKHKSKEIIFAIENEDESRREWMLSIFGLAGKTNSSNKDFQVWQHDNHAVELYTSKFMIEKLDYLHNNPVRSGMVDKAEDYIYSSARRYMDIEGMIDIICLSRPLNM